MAERKRVQVLYSGHVQGVGFRFTTQQLARGFDVVGTVRNLFDGRVELVAEGSSDELSSFLQAIDESDLAGFIKEKSLSWQDGIGGLSGFRIAS